PSVLGRGGVSADDDPCFLRPPTEHARFEVTGDSKAVMAAEHTRERPWPETSATSVVAKCACGWRSGPCSNGELANQTWERHALEVCASSAGQGPTGPRRLKRPDRGLVAPAASAPAQSVNGCQPGG